MAAPAGNQYGRPEPINGSVSNSSSSRPSLRWSYMAVSSRMVRRVTTRRRPRGTRPGASDRTESARRDRVRRRRHYSALHGSKLAVEPRTPNYLSGLALLGFFVEIEADRADQAFL